MKMNGMKAINVLCVLALAGGSGDGARGVRARKVGDGRLLDRSV